ncbi:MAG: N-acetylmuramoyl-L-alanine amidase [Alphaproteobacteria bacterium]|nr:N-acetylmuramoyl-L-alanine amidase [Alphaproteobacteria bacterium]
MRLNIVQRPSPNHDARAEGATDILVMHYTGMGTAEEALQRLCDPEAKVSSHYTVDRDGTVYQHVDESRRARHAGVSYWAGVRDVNSRSIGIEIVNPGHEFGYIPFADPQIAAVIALSQDILARHAIPASRVVGHSDVAPDRKQDPGELFPWPELAAGGVGLWPRQIVSGSAWDAQSFAENLRRYGYGVPPDVDWPLADVVAAFQRHFRPSCITGIPDAECAAILCALLEAVTQ